MTELMFIIPLLAGEFKAPLLELLTSSKRAHDWQAVASHQFLHTRARAEGETLVLGPRWWWWQGPSLSVLSWAWGSGCPLLFLQCQGISVSFHKLHLPKAWAPLGHEQARLLLFLPQLSLVIQHPP